MSKTTLASLQTQVTELTVQFAALSARLDSLAAPVAPATPAKKAEKASKPKDPDAPKKPLSSYLVFSAAKRAEVPEGGAKLTAKILAEQWKALTPEQQAAYKPVAVAVAVAVAPAAVAMGAKPKRPLNAFMRFTVARRAEAPDAKLTAKALGEEWKALSADQQAAYKTPPVSDAESSDDDDGADTSDAE